MAANKSKRSVRTAQPQAQTQPQPQQEPQPRHPDPHLKSQLFEALRHLNRGFAVAVSALDRLQKLDRLRTFPASCLMDYRNRTEELRARANFELLHLFSGREEREAEKFGRMRTNLNHRGHRGTRRKNRVIEKNRSPDPNCAHVPDKCQGTTLAFSLRRAQQAEGCGVVP